MIDLFARAAKEQELRGHLGSFGIKGALATQKMSQLSGGQAVRVGLAAVAYAEPHLLILVSKFIQDYLPSPQQSRLCLPNSPCSLVLLEKHPMCFDCSLTCCKTYKCMYKLTRLDRVSAASG